MSKRFFKVTLKPEAWADKYKIGHKVVTMASWEHASFSLGGIMVKGRKSWNASIIDDNVPDDDSVSGYRFDITIKGKSNNTWELTEVKESWRCWKDRGHREFSVAPCS